MERQCLYNDKMSELKLNNQAKDRILQNLYNIETAREEKKTLRKSRPLVKRASFWIPLTSALCVVILAISILAAVLAPSEQPLPHVFTVNNPLSAEDRLYLTGVAQNAQYLPDIKELSKTSTSGSQVSLSQSDFSQEYPYNSDKSNLYFEVDASEMSLNEETYQDILDNLAINSSVKENDVWTIDSIRKEVQFMMEIIPGYDQWFKLSGKMSYVQNYKDYIGSTYKLSYDKENNIIDMTRISIVDCLDLYDSESRRLYCYYSEPKVILKEVLEVKYYKDSEGKETVECRNTRYFELDGNSYLYSVEILKNIANESASKLSIYNIFNRPLNELFVIDAELNRVVRDVYTLQDYNPYGKVAIFMQVDYSEDNVEILTFDSVYESLYEDYRRTEMMYYGAKGEDVVLYSNMWDYYDSEASCKSVNVGYPACRYTDEYVDGYRIFGPLTKDGINNFVGYYVEPYRCVGDLCSYCLQYDYTDTVKYCPHIVCGDTVTRRGMSKTASIGGIFTAEDSEKQASIVQLEKFNSNINGYEMSFSEWMDEEFGFESEFDAYVESIVKRYIDVTMDMENILATVSDSDNCEIIDDEKMEEIMDNILLGIKSVESNVTAVCGEGCTVNYDVTVTLNGVEPEEGKKYYLAIYFDDNEEAKINGVVIAQKEIDLSAERVYNISGTFDYMDIVKNIKLDYSDSYIYGYAYVGIISYDDAGNIVRETTNKLLSVESERVKYVHTYERDGHLMWYVFDPYSYLYYHIEQM